LERAIAAPVRDGPGIVAGQRRLASCLGFVKRGAQEATMSARRSRSRTFLFLLALALLNSCERVESILYDRAAERLAAGDRTDWLRDGALHVILCGTGSPLADADRAGPCTAVIAGGKFFLIDVGPGSWENVQLWSLPRSQLSAVLLTHFHSDHVGELGEVVVQTWIGGRTQPLAIYGPPGVASVVEGFQRAYAFDSHYRIAHHGEAAMPRGGSVAIAREVPEPIEGGSQVVLEEDGLRVTAFSVDHQPVTPAFGYRFDYNGRSVVISGDTEKSESVVRHARDVDLLLHEALAKEMIGQITPRLRAIDQQRLAKLTADVIDYHTSPVEAAQVARDANVRMLILTHLVPAPANAILRRLFMRGVSEAWDGEVIVGEDGMHFTLPQGSTDIRQAQLE
jgi:ribonuclease Z